MYKGGSLPERSLRQPEFLLVIAMLVALFALVLIVLLVPAPPPDTGTTSKDIMDYRQGLLAVILTAFGAWIGAGAAYYFGRENLAKATESILAMKELSPRERLRKETVRSLNPKLLDWLVSKKETVEEVRKRLQQEKRLWFIPIIDVDRRLVTVISEEAVYDYVSLRLLEMPEETVKKAVESINRENMDALLQWVDKRGRTDSNWLKKTKDMYVPTTMEASAGDVNEQMKGKGVSLAIVIDMQGQPTHFVTTADIRGALLQMT